MPRFAANLSMMYPEHAFLDRFAAAARDGFEAVEYLFPYASRPAGAGAAPAGHTACSRCCSTRRPATGTRASAASPACRAARTSSATAWTGRSSTPQALECPRVHLMAGLVPAGVDREP